MILYHGSNVVVAHPVLTKSRKTLDFGAGFYLTSDEGQAAAWAQRTARIRKTGTPTISIYKVNQDVYRSLSILEFPKAGVEWLRYVVANRRNESSGDDYDVVMGPVANDQTVRTINDYMLGRFSEEIAVELLLPQKLKDQFAFKTDAALAALDFKAAQEA